jgi:isopenicillin N synthase-like dioxygenase
MELPREEKMNYRGKLRGWTDFEEESAQAGYGDGGDDRDARQKYSMGPIITEQQRSAAPAHYEVPKGQDNFFPNLFPDEEFRHAWEEYYVLMELLCGRLLDRSPQLLDFDRGVWAEQTSSPTSVMRFLAYLACDHPLRMAAHYDTLLTIIHQSVPPNGFAALQVQLEQGSDWQSVVPNDDQFALNVGETLTFLSGGVVRATKHRVIGPATNEVSGSERTSLAFFQLPNWNAKLWPALAEGMDEGIGRQSTKFYLENLREPDGSVLYYKAHQRGVGRLMDESSADLQNP